MLSIYCSHKWTIFKMNYKRVHALNSWILHWTNEILSNIWRLQCETIKYTISLQNTIQYTIKICFFLNTYYIILLWTNILDKQNRSYRCIPVSYTHLDVYKRQVSSSDFPFSRRFWRFSPPLLIHSPLLFLFLYDIRSI